MSISPIFYVNVKDIEIFEKIPNFIPLFKYYDNGKEHSKSEWGKLVFGNVEVLIYASSEIKYLFEDICQKSHGKEIC